MSRYEVWLLHLSTALVGGTGLVYAVFRYLLEPVDPYSVVNHPWQPAVQHLHIIVAPLLVFTVGLIWRRHVLGHWRSEARQQHRSGISLILTLTPMVASGYLIQVTVNERWRTIWVVAHCATAGLWILGYLVHQVTSRHQRQVVPRGLEPVWQDD